MAIFRKAKKVKEKKRKNPQKQEGRKKGKRHNSDALLVKEPRSSGITSRKIELAKNLLHEKLVSLLQKGEIDKKIIDKAEREINECIKDATSNHHISYYGIPIITKSGKLKTLIIDLHGRKPSIYFAEDSLAISLEKRKKESGIKTSNADVRAFEI